MPVGYSHFLLVHHAPCYCNILILFRETQLFKNDLWLKICDASKSPWLNVFLAGNCCSFLGWFLPPLTTVGSQWEFLKGNVTKFCLNKSGIYVSNCATNPISKVKQVAKTWCMSHFSQSIHQSIWHGQREPGNLPAGFGCTARGESTTIHPGKDGEHLARTRNGLDVHIVKNHLAKVMFVFPEIALAIRVLTSSIGVRVYRFFGFMLGGNRFLQCTDANTLFCVCCCFASKSRPCDVIGPKSENCGVIKHSLFYFHPAPRPRFVKGCWINMLAYNPQCMYHLSCQVNIYFYIYIYYTYI